MSSKKIAQQIKNCLVDEPTYKKNRKPIIQQITNGDGESIVTLVDIVKETLKDKKTNPESKLIALYFLKEAMDSKNPDLVNYTKEKILKRLSDIAKAKESEVFPAKADERLKKNFYQLLLECIYFWSELFGTDENGKANKYKTTLQNVAKTVDMPKKAVFFTKDKDKDKDKSKKSKTGEEVSAQGSKNPSQFQSSASQPAANQPAATRGSEKGQKEFESVNNAREQPPSTNVRMPEESKTPGGSKKRASKKDPTIQNIEKTLASVQEKKDILYDVLTNEEKPDPDVLEMMGDEFNTAGKELQQSLDVLFNMEDSPEKEAVLNKVLEENEFTANYLENYGKLRGGKMKIAQFRAATITAISASQSPKKVPQEENSTPPPVVETKVSEKRPKKQESPALRDQSPARTEQVERPTKSRRNDFNVDFNTGDQVQAQNQDDNFGNFQSSGGQVGNRAASQFGTFDGSGGQPQNNQFDTGFDQFSQNQNRGRDAGGDAFNNFGTAPSRQREQHPDHDQPQENDAFNNFGTAPAPPRSRGQHYDEAPNNDAFNNFGTAPPGNQGQDGFGDLNQQDQRSQQQFEGFGQFATAPMPQDEFARESFNQARGRRNSQTQNQQRNNSEGFNNGEEPGFSDPFARRDSKRGLPPRPLGNSPRGGFNQNEGRPQNTENWNNEGAKQGQGRDLAFEDFGADFEFDKNPGMENSQHSGFNFDYEEKEKKKQLGTPHSVNSRNAFGDFEGAEDIGGIRGNNKRKSVQQDIKKDPFDDDVFASAAKEAEAEAQALDRSHHSNNPHTNQNQDFGWGSSNAQPQANNNGFDWGGDNGFESHGRHEDHQQQQQNQSFRWDQPQSNAAESHNRRDDFTDFGQQQHAEFERAENRFQNSQRHEPVRANVQDDPLHLKRGETASFNKEFSQDSRREQLSNEPVHQSRFSPQKSHNETNLNNTLSAEKIISKTFVSSKPGDMESEKLRRERDKIMSELENVKRMFNGLKVEHDFMAKNHEFTGNEYNRARSELDDVKRARGYLGSSQEQLRAENDRFRQMRGSLAQENDDNLRVFGDMSREISALKGKLADHNVLDFRQRNETRLYELETSLKNAHNRVSVMHDLNNRVEGEHLAGSLQMDRLRQGYLDPLSLGPQLPPVIDRISLVHNSTTRSSPPRQIVLTPPRSTSLSPPRILLSPPRDVMITPRGRSRSPQVVDLLNMSPPRGSVHPLPTIEEARLSMSQPGLRTSYTQARVSPPPVVYLSTTNQRQSATRSSANFSPPRTLNNAIEEARRARGEIGFGPGGGITRESTTFGSNRQESFPGYPEFNRSAYAAVEYRPQYTYDNNSYPLAQTTIPAQVRIPMPEPMYIVTPPALNFIPKYSPALTTPPLVVSQQIHHTNSAPAVSGDLVAAAPYPQKYSVYASTVASGVQSREPIVRENYVASDLRLNRSVSSNSNPANKTANELIERSRKLREQTTQSGQLLGSMLGSNKHTPQEQENKNRHSRVTSGYLDNDGNVVNNTQTGAAQNQNNSARKASPERSRYQRIERTTSGPYDPKLGLQSNYNRPNAVESESNIFASKYGDVSNRVPLRDALNFDPAQGTGVTSLPAGLYEGSPVRERIVNRSDNVELKPSESLKIVERKLRLSPSRIQNKSSPKTNKYETEMIQEDGESRSGIAHTLKKDLKALKESLNKGNYSSPSDARYKQIGGYEEVVETGFNNARTIKASERSISPNQRRGLEGTKKINLNMNRTTNANPQNSDQDDLQVRQVHGAPGLKLMVGDSYFYQTPNQKVGYKEVTPVGPFTVDDEGDQNLVDPEENQKISKLIPFDHSLFDQLKNTIYGYSFYRDIEAFKAACLLPRATLYDSPYIQISVITKNDNHFLKLIVHYINKSESDINEFSVSPSDQCIQCSPLVQGAALAPKYQLKQEIFVSFFNFKYSPLVMDISYKQDGVLKRMNVALPITLNKFMKFRSDVDKSRFRQGWKLFKENSVTTGYQNINAKFVRSHTEILKYFDNNLFDVTPEVISSSKRKYGGVFDLPDGSEYNVKLTLDNSRIKIAVNSGSSETLYSELITQYLTFLLTV